MSLDQPPLFPESRRGSGSDGDPFGTSSSRFDGGTFDVALDAERLTRQLDAVRHWMLAHSWQTLAEISTGTGFPEASISARLRDLCKPRFGADTVERRRRTAGTWEYRVLANLGDAA